MRRRPVPSWSLAQASLSLTVKSMQIKPVSDHAETRGGRCARGRRRKPDGNLRWTDGDARLPMALFSGFSRDVDVVLYVAARTRYPLLTDAGERAAA
jgi:hypothetical protein